MKANPELVVASARKPSASSTRAGAGVPRVRDHERLAGVELAESLGLFLVVGDTEHHLALLAALGDAPNAALCLLEREHRVDRRCRARRRRRDARARRAARGSARRRSTSRLGLLGDRHDPAAPTDHAQERIAADRVEARSLLSLVVGGERPACELDGEMADAAGRAETERARPPSARRSRRGPARRSARSSGSAALST